MNMGYEVRIHLKYLSGSILSLDLSGILQVLKFRLTSQEHASRWTGYTKSPPRCKCMCMGRCDGLLSHPCCIPVLYSGPTYIERWEETGEAKGNSYWHGKVKQNSWQTLTQAQDQTGKPELLTPQCYLIFGCFDKPWIGSRNAPQIMQHYHLHVTIFLRALCL